MTNHNVVSSSLARFLALVGAFVLLPQVFGLWSVAAAGGGGSGCEDKDNWVCTYDAGSSLGVKTDSYCADSKSNCRSCETFDDSTCTRFYSGKQTKFDDYRAVGDESR